MRFLLPILFLSAQLIAEPGVRWRTPVGLGYSGLAVGDGLAFTIGHADSKDSIIALDAATGSEHWRHSYPQDPVPKYNPGGPNAAPLLAGDWLYSFSKQGLVFCLRATTGQLRWSRDLAADGAGMPVWGFASVPLLLDGRLYLNAGDRGACLDATTGALLWITPGDAAYGAVVPLSYHGKPALALANKTALLLVSRSDGSLLWSYDFPTKWGENSSTPIVSGDSLYYSAWWDQGARLFDLAGAEPREVWRSRELQSHISTPLLHEGHLYAFDGPVHRKKTKRALRCAEFATGKILWSQPDLHGSIQLMDDTLLILEREGAITIAKASPAGFTQLSRHELLGAKTWTPPTLVGRQLFVRDGQDAVCVDLQP
ncbi:MAG: outer membrane protein assembly factor BamB [Rhodothermales bacterium]|jgi:outer membrane protein assembly factor BamB